jgi:hypothetical protein
MIDIDEIWKNLKDYYGDDEDNYRNCFYGAIGWDEVKAMMNELKALREVVEAARTYTEAKEIEHACYDATSCKTCEEIWTKMNNGEDRLKISLKNLDEARRG